MANPQDIIIKSVEVQTINENLIKANELKTRYGGESVYNEIHITPEIENDPDSRSIISINGEDPFVVQTEYRQMIEANLKTVFDEVIADIESKKTVAESELKSLL